MVFTLTSCVWWLSVNNINDDKNKDSINTKTWLSNIDDIYIDKDSYKWNVLIQEEISDRKKGVEEINKNKEYLNKVSKELDDKINSYKDHIEVIRELLLVDMKIVAAIREWLLEEKSINQNNYYYKYLQKLNTSERKKEIERISKMIEIVENKEKFKWFYFVNFSLNNVDIFSEESKLIFKYTNFYINNVKFKTDIFSDISIILKSMTILNKEKVLISSKWNRFISDNNDFYIYQNALKNLWKELLDK